MHSLSFRARQNKSTDTHSTRWHVVSGERGISELQSASLVEVNASVRKMKSLRLCEEAVLTFKVLSDESEIERKSNLFKWKCASNPLDFKASGQKYELILMDSWKPLQF